AQSEKRSCVRSLSIDVVRARLRGLAEILEGLRGGDRLPRPLDEELRLHESLEALHLLAGGGEEEKGGKASHLEALRDGGGLVRVDPHGDEVLADETDHSHVAEGLAVELLAPAAPFGAEVDEHGAPELRRLRERLVEIVEPRDRARVFRRVAVGLRRAR